MALNIGDTTEFAIKDKYTRFGLYKYSGELKQGACLYLGFETRDGAQEAIDLIGDLEKDINIRPCPEVSAEVLEKAQVTLAVHDQAPALPPPRQQVQRFSSCFSSQE